MLEWLLACECTKQATNLLLCAAKLGKPGHAAFDAEDKSGHCSLKLTSMAGSSAATRDLLLETLEHFEEEFSASPGAVYAALAAIGSVAECQRCQHTLIRLLHSWEKPIANLGIGGGDPEVRLTVL